MKYFKCATPFISLIALYALPAAAEFKPANKVECIAPSTPGGGWDFTCRSVGTVLSELDLIPRTMQTVNMPGASGAIGFSHVISKRKGDENLLVAASTATTSQMAQGKYPGDESMVTWIGTLGSDYGIFAVSKNSPYNNINELISAIKKDPKSVKFTGGSGVGGWDHLKLLMAAKAAGVEHLNQIPWLSSHGGGQALTQVIGGHITAYSGDISEAAGFIESGDLKVLALLAPERLQGKYANIPTAKEQGIDVIGANWRGFYMPSDISNDAKTYWVNAIDKLYASENWKDKMASNGLKPFHLSGDEFDKFVKTQIQEMRSLSKEIGLIK